MEVVRGNGGVVRGIKRMWGGLGGKWWGMWEGWRVGGGFKGMGGVVWGIRRGWGGLGGMKGGLRGPEWNWRGLRGS